MNSTLRPHPRRSFHLCVLAATLAFLWASLPRSAQQVTVLNDSITTINPTGAIQTGFVDGEGAAAWLTSPCEGEITAVQVLWLSLTGGAPVSLQEAVRVYEAGIFPSPGTIRADLPGPLLTDGFFNEFTLPTPLPVANGEQFVAELIFLDPPSVLGPSVVTDVDGCQAGKNGIFAIPPASWFSSCLLGVSGDFAIRGLVTCTALPTLIFTNGFESGDTTLWSSVVP